MERKMPAKKIAKVTKSNELNNANFTDFSLSSYRVFLNLLAKLQHYDNDGNLVPLEMSNRTCSLSAAEYAKEFKTDESHAYRILKSAVDHLLKTSYSIPHANGDILKINICSQAYYRKNNGNIDVKFTEEIIPHISGLAQKFTMYHLSDVAGFDSIYTTRLFELIQQYKTTGMLKITLKDLRFALGCSNKFKLYADFKRKTFEHATNEINAQFEVNLLYEEVKSGRAVTDILFTFNKITTTQAYDTVKEKYRTQVPKHKRIKAPVQAKKEVLTVHPDQQELSLEPVTEEKIVAIDPVAEQPKQQQQTSNFSIKISVPIQTNEQIIEPAKQVKRKKLFGIF
jgi:plasmid replication initiation protein